MTPPSPARVVAARVLERVECDLAFADLALEHELALRELDARDAALATELVYGTLRWQRYLDWLLRPHSKRPLETLDPGARVLLRLTVYQLVMLQRVPVFAAVNDAVTLAGWRSRRGLPSYVNAVLRVFARQNPVGREPPLPRDPTEALATRWSFPTWLAARWIDGHGRDDAVALMQAMNERPPLTVRANTLVTTREALAERLAVEERLESRPTPYAPDGLVIRPGGNPGGWRAFTDGALAVQDEASMLISHLLRPRPGDVVADACAAPGTKTGHLAQLMGNRGRLLALDRDALRLARVTETAARLGVTIAETLPGMVEALAPRLANLCDGVLVDAPCSNLGVLRRNPEVKWRRHPADLLANAERQGSVLAAAATMVKAGGIVVYATCSLEGEENDEVVRRFLAEHPTFRVDRPDTFPIPLDAAGVLRCLPHRHGTDGFTAIRLRRQA